MKTFLVGAMWFGVASLVFSVFIVACGALKNRKRRNFGVPPKFKSGGMVFICCEHDEQCERSGMPCPNWLRYQNERAQRLIEARYESRDSNRLKSGGYQPRPSAECIKCGQFILWPLAKGICGFADCPHTRGEG